MDSVRIDHATNGWVICVLDKNDCVVSRNMYFTPLDFLAAISYCYGIRAGINIYEDDNRHDVL